MYAVWLPRPYPASCATLVDFHGLPSFPLTQQSKFVFTDHIFFFACPIFPFFGKKKSMGGVLLPKESSPPSGTLSRLFSACPSFSLQAGPFLLFHGGDMDEELSGRRVLVFSAFRAQAGRTFYIGAAFFLNWSSHNPGDFSVRRRRVLWGSGWWVVSVFSSALFLGVIAKDRPLAGHSRFSPVSSFGIWHKPYFPTHARLLITPFRGVFSSIRHSCGPLHHRPGMEPSSFCEHRRGDLSSSTSR